MQYSSQELIFGKYLKLCLVMFRLIVLSILISLKELMRDTQFSFTYVNSIRRNDVPLVILSSLSFTVIFTNSIIQLLEPSNGLPIVVSIFNHMKTMMEHRLHHTRNNHFKLPLIWIISHVNIAFMLCCIHKIRCHGQDRISFLALWALSTFASFFCSSFVEL